MAAFWLDAAKILAVDIKHDKDSYVCTVQYVYKYVCVLCACEVGQIIDRRPGTTACPGCSALGTKSKVCGEEKNIVY